VKNAANAFVEALADTGIQAAVTAFSTTARDGVVPYQEVTSDNLSTFTNWINNRYRPNGATNWQDGLLQVNRVSTQFGVAPADLVVFVTDGDPNRYNEGAGIGNGGPGSGFDQTALNRAVRAANGLKTSPISPSPSGNGSHVFVVGVGPAGHPGSDQERRLAAISGTNRFPDEHRDFATADYTLATNFNDLRATLTRIVVGLCGSSLEITKYERAPDDTGWHEANGWAFAATLEAQPGHQWLTPRAGASPSASVTTGPQPSGSEGMAVFGWRLTGAPGVDAGRRPRALQVSRRRASASRLTSTSPSARTQRPRRAWWSRSGCTRGRAWVTGCRSRSPWRTSARRRVPSASTRPRLAAAGSSA
jgi:hypothetical protein